MSASEISSMIAEWLAIVVSIAIAANSKKVARRIRAYLVSAYRLSGPSA